MNKTIARLAVAALAVAWACLTVAAPVSEEEELALVYGDKSTVSIATGSSQPLHRAPSVASVITAEDIAAMGAKNLDEVMEAVPGVHVSRAAFLYVSTYTLRGIYGNPTNPQVLMLQNGIPTNSLHRGDKGQSIGAPSLENIARIEIIRGPGSALYGADAFSGVINIITATPARRWARLGHSIRKMSGCSTAAGTARWMSRPTCKSGVATAPARPSAPTPPPGSTGHSAGHPATPPAR
jgi:iron complex outermembrane receptor protein